MYEKKHILSVTSDPSILSLQKVNIEVGWCSVIHQEHALLTSYFCNITQLLTIQNVNTLEECQHIICVLAIWIVLGVYSNALRKMRVFTKASFREQWIHTHDACGQNVTGEKSFFLIKIWVNGMFILLEN